MQTPKGPCDTVDDLLDIFVYVAYIDNVHLVVYIAGIYDILIM